MVTPFFPSQLNFAPDPNFKVIIQSQMPYLFMLNINFDFDITVSVGIWATVASMRNPAVLFFYI